MADARLSPPSYLKYAIKDQHNLVVLFGAACFSLAFASRIPLMVGAGAELLWLLIGPQLPAFRGWVDRQLDAQYMARAEEAIQVALGELSDADASRFRALNESAMQLLGRARLAAAPRELKLAVHGLLEYRRTFLDYLFLGQRLDSLLDPTPASAMEAEATQLQQSYSAERDLTARMTIRQAQTALQRRIRQQATLDDVRRALDRRLIALEEALLQLHEPPTDPASGSLAQEIEQALAGIGPAEPLEQTLDREFES